MKETGFKKNKFIPPSVDRMMAELSNTKFFSKPLPIVNMSAPSKSGFSLKGHAQIRPQFDFLQFPPLELSADLF